MYLRAFLICFLSLSIFVSCKDDEPAYIPIDNEPVTFLPTLSDMNLFSGDLNNLTPNENNRVYTYEPSIGLFTDFAYKQRLIRIPQGYHMTYNGDGLPIFPERTLLAKTFYYYNNEQNQSLGKQIIETRVLILNNGIWESGNYIWNDSQTEATLTTEGSDKAISWIDDEGITQNITYKIPSNTNCFTCHRINPSTIAPIGFKLRNLNFTQEGENTPQLDRLGFLFEQLPNLTSITSLPTWNTSLHSNEELSRAYFDINCAHCHSPGGDSESASFDLRYETSFNDSGIFGQKDNMKFRMQSNIQGFRMPSLGRTIVDDDHIDVITTYLDSL